MSLLLTKTSTIEQYCKHIVGTTTPRNGAPMAQFYITIAGDSALNVEFKQEISPEISGLVHSCARMLEEHPIEGVIECIPTICSLMVCYNPQIISYEALCACLQTRLKDITGTAQETRRIVEIPVCYGGEFGPDIDFVAEHAQLSVPDVIRIHAGVDYLIDMLGFMPGFAYLGGLDKRLHTPRLQSPRTCIEASSVGIGGAQTGIYPLPSPGGWRLIGKSPVCLYDPFRDHPILYAAGDYLRFIPISEEDFHCIQAQVQAHTYTCNVVVEHTSAGDDEECAERGAGVEHDAGADGNSDAECGEDNMCDAPASTLNGTNTHSTSANTSKEREVSTWE